MYTRKYEEKLLHLALPIQKFDRYDIEEALKDLERELVCLNGNIFVGSDAIEQIRLALKSAVDSTVSLSLTSLSSSSSSSLSSQSESLQEELINIMLRFVLIASSR